MNDEPGRLSVPTRCPYTDRLTGNGTATGGRFGPSRRGDPDPGISGRWGSGSAECCHDLPGREVHIGPAVDDDSGTVSLPSETVRTNAATSRSRQILIISGCSRCHRRISRSRRQKVQPSRQYTDTCGARATSTDSPSHIRPRPRPAGGSATGERALSTAWSRGGDSGRGGGSMRSAVPGSHRVLRLRCVNRCRFPIRSSAGRPGRPRRRCAGCHRPKR